MLGKLRILGQQHVFTSDDRLDAVVSIPRRCAEPVSAQLICEGMLHHDNEIDTVTYYKSQAVSCNFSEESTDSAEYTFSLRFPIEALSVPSSLSFEHHATSVRWSVEVKAQRDIAKAAQVIAKAPVKFLASKPLPSLLELVETEYDVMFDGAALKLITSHAAAGLPQVPLAAGIGLCLESSEIKCFGIRRLRLWLNEQTSIDRDGDAYELPSRRWLLDDLNHLQDVRITSRRANLDALTNDIRIDHALLSPTFETNEISHRFDLVVELTLFSPRSRAEKRLVAVSPVNVLPRSACSNYGIKQYEADMLYVSADTVDITDSSDDGSDYDGDSGLISDGPDGAGYLSDAAYSSGGSSCGAESGVHSVRSTFSDHLKLEFEDRKPIIPTISFSNEA